MHAQMDQLVLLGQASLWPQDSTARPEPALPCAGCSPRHPAAAARIGSTAACHGSWRHPPCPHTARLTAAQTGTGAACRPLLPRHPPPACPLPPGVEDGPQSLRAALVELPRRHPAAAGRLSAARLAYRRPGQRRRPLRHCLEFDRRCKCMQVIEKARRREMCRAKGRAGLGSKSRALRAPLLKVDSSQRTAWYHSEHRFAPLEKTP